MPESLGFYFEIVTRDTLCEGARLELELVEALMRCGACGCEWDPAPLARRLNNGAARLRLAVHEQLAPALPVFRCPACEPPARPRSRGDELEVESIEVAEAVAVTQA